MSDKYVYVTSSWAQCFKMKIKLPKHFHNVSKKNEEYKKWKKSEDDKFDNTITLMDDECWWNNFEEKEKKELIKDYGTKEYLFFRRHYWQGSAVTSFSKCKYKEFNSFLPIKKFFEGLALHRKKLKEYFKLKKSKFILKK
jgi:hypothetical protein